MDLDMAVVVDQAELTNLFMKKPDSISEKLRAIFPQVLLDAEKSGCDFSNDALKGHLDNTLGDALRSECQLADREIALRQQTPPAVCTAKGALGRTAPRSWAGSW
jgi:hypothetical protein